MKLGIILILSIAVLSACTITGNAVKKDATLTSESNLDDFHGKPSIILFGGTYCGHCQQAVPVFKEKVDDVYSDKVNIWINVVDGGKFDVEEIPQGLNSNLIFDDITETGCKYVPSWIILDENGDVALSSCGGEKEMGDMIKTIGGLV